MRDIAEEPSGTNEAQQEDSDEQDETMKNHVNPKPLTITAEFSEIQS